MNFIIRDDDLNYFSMPSDILKWYKDVFDQGIPVGFSTIPFVKTTSDVYTGNTKENNREYPISQNKGLVDFVKNHPLIEIMQHGCTHETKNKIFEYQQKTCLFNETEKGKKELERAFNKTPKIFIAPHDSFSNQAIKAIEKNEMDIIRGKFHSRRQTFIFRKQYFINVLKTKKHRRKHGYQKDGPAYPYVLDFKKHKEAYSYRLKDDNLEDLIKGLNYSYKVKGTFIITNHLHHCNNKRKNNLKILINRAKNFKAHFVFPYQIY
jgi:peptidoglycan/xylan/chitin deacetylase (PgdA/CDA1 family)